jgi:hypothetical protein
VSESVSQTHREIRRVLNADRRRLARTGRMLALVCECGDPRCHATVVMSVEAFDARGDEPILHPSHAATR